MNHEHTVARGSVNERFVQGGPLQSAPAPPRTRPDAPSTAAGRPTASRATVWAWLRVLGGAAIIGFLLWRLGTGPFWHGLR